MLQFADRDTACQWLARGIPISEICELLGCDPVELKRLPRRRRGRNVETPSPTPAEIAARAKLVRLKWSELEHERRMVGHVVGQRYEIPCICTNDVGR